MRVCVLAKPTGKTCDDGWSKLILCEQDGVLRCLRDCRHGCASYREKAEQTAVGGRQVAGRGVSVSGKPSVKSSGGCVGSPVPCGQNAPSQKIQNRSW